MLLEFLETEKLLKKYKIPFIETQLIKDKKEALSFVRQSAWPIVLKIFSKEVLHKTEINGVILNIQDKKSLFSAFERMKKLAQKFKAQILIQKQIQGRELILGAKKDPIFGPVVIFGAGGIFVEIIKDVSFRLAPLSKKEAKKMINETKISKILKGARGKERENLEKLSQVLVNLSKLISKEKNIKEIDLNPTILTKKEVFVVDAKIIRD